MVPKINIWSYSKYENFGNLFFLIPVICSVFWKFVNILFRKHLITFAERGWVSKRVRKEKEWEEMLFIDVRRQNICQKLQESSFRLPLQHIIICLATKRNSKNVWILDFKGLCQTSPIHPLPSPSASPSLLLCLSKAAKRTLIMQDSAWSLRAMEEN